MDKDWRDRMQDIAYQKAISSAEIARKTNMSTASISRILSKQRNTKLDNIRLIADALGVTTEQLLHGTEQSQVATSLRVPVLKEDEVIGWLSEPATFSKNKMQWICCNVEDCSPATFAVKVIDSDMIDPTGQESFPPGSIIFVDPELNPFVDGEQVAIGLYVLIQLEDDGPIIFRQLERATGRWYAAPKNPKYESIQIDLKSTKFIGTVLAQIQQYIKHNMD